MLMRTLRWVLFAFCAALAATAVAGFLVALERSAAVHRMQKYRFFIPADCTVEIDGVGVITAPRGGSRRGDVGLVAGAAYRLAVERDGVVVREDRGFVAPADPIVRLDSR
jgi:hypothetical protein